MGRSVFKIITKEKQIDKLIDYCKKTGYASIDFETSGKPFQSPVAYPTILGVSFQPGSAWIIPLGHFDSPFLEDDQWVKILKKFGKEVLENPEIIKIAWNLKFEFKWLLRYDIHLKGRLFDGMLAKYLLNEERPSDLKSMVRKYLPEFGGYEENYEGAKLDWDKKPLKGLSEYCGLDCDLTFRLMIFFEYKLIDLGFYSLFRNMMMMGTRVLAYSEFQGIDVDVDYLDGLVEKYKVLIEDKDKSLRKSKKVLRFEIHLQTDRLNKLIKEVKLEIESIKTEIEDLHETEDDPNELVKILKRKEKQITNREEKISRYYARDFTTKKEMEIMEPINFSSPNQMIELFFTHSKGFKFKVVKYTVDKKTKKETERPSTDEEVLLELIPKDKSGFIENLLDYRGLTKLNSTYVVGMREKVSIENKIHGSFLLHGTVTGRLSSSNPNLQNIPRDTTASDIKKMFVPKKPYLLLQLDYSQAELRVLAAQAGETTMIEWFKSGKDIHLASACKKWGEDYNDIIKIYKNEDDPEYTTWKIRRKQAKTINFGIVYGQGPKMLAPNLSDIKSGVIVTLEEAKGFLRDFDRDFPMIAKHIKKQHKFAHKHGFVYNVFGRKRRLPNIDLPQITERQRRDNWGKVAEAERQCVDIKTEALTKTGWKKYNELIKGELILTKNIDTNQLEWEEIQQLNIYPDFKGNLYEFKNDKINSFSALTTGNHRWLCNVTSKRDTKGYYTSSELYDGKLRLINRQGDYEGPLTSPYSDDFIRFIGLILTDGSLKYYDLSDKPRHGRPHYISLTQSYKANMPKVEIIQELIYSLGYKFRLRDHKETGSYQWRFDIGIARELDDVIPNKELSMKFLLKLPSSQLNILLGAMKLGDGHRGNKAIITGKENQADLIQVLNILTGSYSNINIRDNIGRKCYSDNIPNKKGYIEIKNKSYSVTTGAYKTFHTKSSGGKNHIKKLENQKQLVWCPTVNNGNWVCRREGKSYITGNSVNAPIQGAASDYTLFSSIIIYEQIQQGVLPKDLKQVYTVHDSLGYLIRPEDIHETIPKLEAICRNPQTMKWFGFQIDNVQMKVDFEIGTDWGSLKNYKEDFDYTSLH